jgi:hypothetical protein
MNTATIVCDEACDASDDIKTLVAECVHQWLRLIEMKTALEEMR